MSQTDLFLLDKDAEWPECWFVWFPPTGEIMGLGQNAAEAWHDSGVPHLANETVLAVHKLQSGDIIDLIDYADEQQYITHLDCRITRIFVQD